MNKAKYIGKKAGFVLGAALFGMLTAQATYAQVSVDVVIHSESDFYEPLTPHGEWVVVGSYGRCWRPARVAHGWRPYCNGSWQRTDAGWYWVSDEPWGWATYHYGRWDYNAQFGWFWVPQTVWAPAWVSWHEGGGYIGWAPLPPSGSVDVIILQPRIVFVEERRFLEPIRPTTVVENNTTIINKTVIKQAPQVEVIEKVSGQKIQTAQAPVLRHKEEAAVVVKQKGAAPASEKNVKQAQPPTPAEAQPVQKKAAPVREPSQAEKSVVTPNAAESPTPKKTTQDLNQQKPATQQVQPDENSRARKEAKPEPKPEAVQPSKHESKPETKPETKPVVKPEAKPDSKPEAKPEGEKNGKKEDKADKESEKKDEGQPAQ